MKPPLKGVLDSEMQNTDIECSRWVVSASNEQTKIRGGGTNNKHTNNILHHWGFVLCLSDYKRQLTM